MDINGDNNMDSFAAGHWYNLLAMFTIDSYLVSIVSNYAASGATTALRLGSRGCWENSPSFSATYEIRTRCAGSAAHITSISFHYTSLTHGG